MVINNRSLTGERYIQDILQQHVVPFVPYIGENLLLMQDNARPHVARVVRNYLDEIQINTLAWPARSPDLNPIENLWDILNRRLRSEPPEPNNLGERQIHIWENLDKDAIRQLILSMNRRFCFYTANFNFFRISELFLRLNKILYIV